MAEADVDVAYATNLQQVFPRRSPISTGDVHNLEIRIRYRRVLRIGSRDVSDEADGDCEDNTYIPPSIFRYFDELAVVLRRHICGRLGLNLDDESVNGVAQVVYNNLNGGVCDEMHRMVVVVIAEVTRIESRADRNTEYEYDQQFEVEYGDVVEEEESGEEELPVRLDIIAGSEGFGEMCAICWNVFAARTGVMKLPCDHLFHDECIEAWFVRKLNCPMCRKRITVG